MRELETFYGEGNGVFYVRWLQEGDNIELLEERPATQEETSDFWYRFFASGGLPCRQPNALSLKLS